MNDHSARLPVARGTTSFSINLTGEGSHVLVMEPGVGSLSIGPAAMGKKVDLHVEPQEPIDWRALNPFFTPSGSPWPRRIAYNGGDASVFEWARTRAIEDLTWNAVLPTDRTIDASRSRIGSLTICLGEPGGRLNMTLPTRSAAPGFRLQLEGDLSRVSTGGELPSRLTLMPATRRRRTDPPYDVPDMGMLHQVEQLALLNEPKAQPVSLRCLANFPNLRSLDLGGEFTDLDQLARLHRLTHLGLRYMADLDGLPPLDTWSELDGFVAFNVEEVAGKRLKQELNARIKSRPFSKHASISKLRTADWWDREHGRSFSGLPTRLAKLANEAFDTAQAALAQARTLAEAEAAITAFTRRFNGVKGVETTDREALAEAVWQLSQSNALAALGMTEALAIAWFDAARDY